MADRGAGGGTMADSSSASLSFSDSMLFTGCSSLSSDLLIPYMLAGENLLTRRRLTEEVNKVTSHNYCGVHIHVCSGCVYIVFPCTPINIDRV